jgi:CRP/FNR family transcriptional regulator
MAFTDPILLEEIKINSRTKRIERGDILISPNDQISFVPIVQKGVLRIVREDEEGRELFLYHLYPGQTCAMSINCCQAGSKSMVKAIAEDQSELLMIPVKLVDEWFKYPEWKAFVTNTYAQRFNELLQVIDLIAFNQMDKQLLHYLQERGRALNTQTLEITHQHIADELNTHREAISRLLRVMESKNLIKLGRNNIKIL